MGDYPEGYEISDEMLYSECVKKKKTSCLRWKWCNLNGKEGLEKGMQ